MLTRRNLFPAIPGAVLAGAAVAASATQAKAATPRETIDVHGDMRIHGERFYQTDFVFRGPDAKIKVCETDGLGPVFDECTFTGYSAQKRGLGVLIGTPGVKIRACQFSGFIRALDIRSHLFRATECVFRNNVFGVYLDCKRYLPGRGENNAFMGCSFSGNRVGVLMNRAHASFIQCSFDYNTRSGAVLLDRSTLRSMHCHFETEKGYPHVVGSPQREWLDTNSQIHTVRHVGGFSRPHGHVVCEACL